MIRGRIALPFLLLALLVVTACRTAGPAPSGPVPTDAMRSLMQREDVARGMAAIDADREAIVTQWRTITEIPSPSGQEGKRADAIEALLKSYGLQNVHRDSVGNVIGVRPGTGGGKRVVFDAHMDTVFAIDTNVTTRIENGKLYAPGVGDDTRNIIALLAMIRALNAAKISTKGDLTFVFTVEEETSFRGADAFLKDHAKEIDRYVALDGGFNGFTYGGTGIYWHRYHIIGPGGHTRSDTPPYSATLPLARAVQRLYALKVPKTSWLNVGMLGGADVFNAKAADAWMSVDLRSTVESELHGLDATIQKIVSEEAARAGMTMKRDQVSIEEVASLPGHRNSEMVHTAEAVYRAFGLDPSITNTASNHTSAAIRAGIPAIGMGAGDCEGSHGLHENCDIATIFPGIQRTLVLAVALSE
ncbi:MAG: tripeptide aminopeptidase [Acidobacteriota bacterium]|jgi:acetylornithine deacetylase/succinyl-diaminopimelate desuccinylase-like protein|nr:tripeptide aminopeptidase [Acidobacteriota bacterium]